MKRFFVALAAAAMMAAGLLAGCSGVSSNEVSSLEDGTYTVDFTTDSSMIHVNDALDGKATLTVENGEGTVHVVFPSKNIVNLYPGLAEEVKTLDQSQLLQPTEEEVTYDDGYTETVNAFDIPVSVIDEEFDMALIGTKGKWYDHKVSISNVQPA